MKSALTHCRIFTPEGWLDDHALLIDCGRISDIVPQSEIPATNKIHDLGGMSVLPGFIDTQVNGGGGYLLNDDPTVDTIAAIGTAHRSFGTTGFLPTLISDDLEKVEKAIAAVDKAIELGVPGVLGIHLEGPFLSTDRKGVHDPSKFRHLEEKHIHLLSSLKRGVTIVTLSPEQASPVLIRTLSERGVIVCAGHTNATYSQMQIALDSGVKGFTHLFNAMSQMSSREPGVVGAALEDQNAWCGLIVDGHHVSPTALNIALKCKPHSKFMLVTDAMPSVGMSEDFFMLQGRRIVVSDGACRDEDGTLAGSNLDMASAIRNATATLEVSHAEAINMATSNPATFLGVAHEIGTIAPGFKADLAVVNNQMEVISTWINGIHSEPVSSPSKAKRDQHYAMGK